MARKENGREKGATEGQRLPLYYEMTSENVQYVVNKFYDSMKINLPIDGRKVFNAYSIFAISFLFHILTIFQGIDVTDLGFHLTNQVSSSRIPIDINEVESLIFLTDYIGGMWLSVAGSPSVIWARLGGVLVFSLNTAIIFSILVSYFDRKKVFAVVFISSLFVTMRFGICIIDYFTFPALLMSIELWILNKLLISTACTKRYHIYSFLLGFIVIPIILSRITLILFILIPIAILFYYIAVNRNLSGYIRTSLLAVSGLSCSILFFILFYRHIGLSANYSTSVLATLGDSARGVHGTHNVWLLIPKYIRQFIQITVSTACLLGGIYVIAAIGQRLGNRVAEGLIFLATAGVIALFFLSRLSINSFALIAINIAFGVVIFLSGIFLTVNRGQDRNLTLLLLAGIITMIITPIGSADGLKESFGMWLILPLSILCAYKLQDSEKSGGILSILPLMNCFMTVTLVMSLFFHYTNIYRDNPNRFELNTEFSNHSLRAIYSTKERVKVLDELLYQIQKHTNKGDTIFAVTSIPLIYYLTETRSAIGYSWPGVCPLDKIKERQQLLESANNLPKLFVFQKVSTRDRNWPHVSEIEGNDDSIQILQYLKVEYIKILRYRLLWENEAFGIYIR
ncbi:MAG: hypothetical protein ABSC54_00490 [Smithellaceae bacterium]